MTSFQVWMVVIWVGYFVLHVYRDHKHRRIIKELRAEMPSERLRKTKNYEILIDADTRMEPTFTLRARDVVAQQAIQEYLRDAKALYVNDPNHPFILEVAERVKEFEDYERRHKNVEDNEGDWKVRTPD